MKYFFCFAFFFILWSTPPFYALDSTSNTLLGLTKLGIHFSLVSTKQTQETLQAQNLKNFDLIHMECDVLLGGTFMEKALELAKNAQIPVSINLADAQLASTYKERILGLLSFYSHILFVGEQEAFALTGLPPDKAALFLNNFCKIVIIKAKNNGSWVYSEKICFHCPENSLSVANSSELFASGFLYGHLKGLPSEICCKFGRLASSMAAENREGEAPNDRWQKLKACFEQIGCKQSNPSL